MDYMVLWEKRGIMLVYGSPDLLERSSLTVDLDGIRGQNVSFSYIP